MADTAKRLGLGQLASATATLYTVPASTTTIVKQIVLHNGTATDRTVTMGVGVDAAGTRFLNAINVPAGEAIVLDVWIVLTAAETLRGHASAASAIQYEISGVEVS